MYCVKCGAKNDDDSKFCTKCGTGLQIYKYTGTVNIKKTVNKDVEVLRFGKIDIKSRKIMVVVITVIAIIILAYTFLFDNRDKDIYDNTEGLMVASDIDDTIVISDNQNYTAQSQETPNVTIYHTPSGKNNSMI